MPTDKLMFFGTEERMTWIKCPDAGLPMSPGRYSSESGFLNGGAYVRQSDTVHRTYELTWAMADGRTRHEMAAYDEGLYGAGPFYFLLPGTLDNVLPQYWASPRLAATDGPKVTEGDRPSLVPVTASGARHGYPTASAHYVLEETENPRRASVKVPVPEGYALHLGAVGRSTGDITVSWRQGGEWQPLEMLPFHSSAPTNTVVDTPGMVELSIQGFGTLTVNAITAAIRPIGEPGPTTFRPGLGHSGVKFAEGGAEITLYSAAKDWWNVSASFIEVGAWA